ncbi:MAG TPA: hypothetical protein VFV92_07055, partial [Candidatus Bathyarchaeia archaeon]|nr:hypothetical protein [Candidatus Bathyarchaeia archaeon]
MNSRRFFHARYFAAGLLLLTLMSTVSLQGHGATPLSVNQSNSLRFTINPDRSVDIGWNSNTKAPFKVNSTGLLGGSYNVHSSSNFTQQTNAVVQTTVTDYQLPPTLAALVNSISLNATQTGLTGNGNLKISTNLPLQSLSINYTTSPSKVTVDATAQLQLGCSLLCTGSLANETAFQQFWAKTFGNSTWTSNIEAQIENVTQHNVTATLTSTEVDSISSATVSIHLIVAPAGTAADFVNVLANILAMHGMSGMNSIIQQVLTLETGSTTTLTYSSSTGKLVIRTVTDYVGDLDSQVNSLKTQVLQNILTPLKMLGAPIPPQLIFLNSTTVTVSKISTTSDLDLNSGTSNMSLNGLAINPPTVGTNTNFTIPGLFQTLGAANFTATPINITLAGGSDSNNQVKIIVPAGTPTPTSTTSNS